MDARDEAALARRDVLQPLDHAGAGVLQVGLVPRGEQRRGRGRAARRTTPRR